MWIQSLLFISLATATFPLNDNITADAIPTSDIYVGYVQEPPGRGTSSLVISCLTTLILCVWSALHLNVPIQGQTSFQTVIINIKWIFAGIYAPELVVFTAWRQWSSARILTKVIDDCVRKKRRDSLDLNDSDPRFEWSTQHSFFACTGGFAFELDSLKNFVGLQHKEEEYKPVRLTITARGVALLAKCGYLPRVTKEEIMDKSKANDLAKAAVLVQASWMLLQVLGRLVQKLPVSLLEVNTVAHVLCAFVMYIFWWNKPLLPNEPIIIHDDGLASLAAFMYASSEMSGCVAAENVKSQTVVKTLFAHLSLYSKSPELEMLSLQARKPPEDEGLSDGAKVVCPNSLKFTSIDVTTVSAPHEEAAARSLSRSKLLRAPTSCLQTLRAKREKEAGTAFFERRPRIIAEQQSAATTITQRRWELVEEALYTYEDELLNGRTALSHYQQTDSGAMEKCVHLKPEQLVATHIQNWPWDDLLRNVNGLVVGMILWLANLCYGGIHLAAWNDHFPSTIEKWCWRSSACYIGFCGGLWILLNLVVATYPSLNEFWERWMDGEKRWWQSFGLGLLVFVCGLSLVLARAFIVVEAFLSIRDLPAEVYETPQWSNIFPHF